MFGFLRTPTHFDTPCLVHELQAQGGSRVRACHRVDLGGTATGALCVAEHPRSMPASGVPSSFNVLSVDTATHFCCLVYQGPSR